MRIKYLIFFILINIFITGISYSSEATTQNINIKFIPKQGIVYPISANSTKRAVIDLGFFNETARETEIELGTVMVTIKMYSDKGVCVIGDSGDGENALEIQSIDLGKLKTQMNSYLDQHITVFNKGGKVEQVELKMKSPPSIGNIIGMKYGDYIFFGCDQSKTVTTFDYRFDLVLKIHNISVNTMVGVSPKKEKDGTVYLNIRDIVLEQLQASTVNGGKQR